MHLDATRSALHEADREPAAAHAEASRDPSIDPGPVGGAEPRVVGFRPLDHRPQRVLFFGKSRARTRATSGFVEAFEAHGASVRWLNFARLRRRLGRRLARAWCRRVVLRFRPDLIFAVHPDLPIDLLRDLRAGVGQGRFDARIVQWCDLPLDEVGDRELESFGASDLSFLVNPARIPWFAERGVHRLVPALESFSPTDHHPVVEGSIDERYDLVFIGGPGRTGARARFLFELAATHPLRIHGLGWDQWRAAPPRGVTFGGEVRPDGYRRLCAEARIVLGDNQVNDASRYFSNRTVLTLACAGFHLTRRVPGLGELYGEGRHLAAFGDLDECRRLIDHYLPRREERRQIARAGCALVHRRDTFARRLDEVLGILCAQEAPADGSERGGPA